MKKLLMAFILLTSIPTFAEAEVMLVRGDYWTPDYGTHIVHNESGLYVRGFKVNRKSSSDTRAPMVRAEKIGTNKYRVKDLIHMRDGGLTITSAYREICLDEVQIGAVDEPCRYINIVMDESIAAIGDQLEVNQVFHLDSGPESFQVTSELSISRDGKVIKRVNVIDYDKDDRNTGKAYIIN